MRTQYLKRTAAFILALVLMMCIFTVPAFAEGETPQMKDNAYQEGVGFRVAMSGPLADPMNAFTITGPDGDLTITEVTDDGGNLYTIHTAEQWDMYEQYTFTYNGETFYVRMPIIYSTAQFEADYTYEGDDLGATWTPEKTTFRVWAPTATTVASHR